MKTTIVTPEGLNDKKFKKLINARKRKTLKKYGIDRAQILRVASA